MLALGIGGNVAVYQLVDAVLLSTLPVREPRELAIVELANLTHWKGRRTTGFAVLTNPLWEQFRDHQDVFSGVLAWAGADLHVDRDRGLRARGLFVSGDFFNVLGVRALRGRVFTAKDDRRGCGTPGAVVSYGFWQRYMGGDADVLERTIELNAHPVPVIGVTPPEFTGLETWPSPSVRTRRSEPSRAGSIAARSGGSRSSDACRQGERSIL